MKKGKVSLVGAGPGHPELISVKGLRHLKEAEVLIYDALIHPDLLKYPAPSCEKIYVGKKGGEHSLPQNEISQLLIQKAKEGRLVVRLKGGDPFIFGRGGEEALALADAGVPFEIVPGIPALAAVPAYAGIPITHRDFNSSLAVITGHEASSKVQSDLDWSKIATGFDTLIIYMGVKNLPNIIDKLVQNGRPASDLIAIIKRGTYPDQHTIIGTLSNIVQLAQAHNLEPPALIIVGQVVKLHDKLNWYEKLPLYGKKIVVTRSSAQAGKLSSMLQDLGAEVILFPTIKIEPIKENPQLIEVLKNIENYHWIVFTSANAVEIFFSQLYKEGLDSRALGKNLFAVIGPATFEALQSFGIKADLIPHSYTTEALAEAFKEKIDLAGKNILLPRADLADDTLTHALQKQGAFTKQITIYNTLIEDSTEASEIVNLIQKGQIAMVTFTSSSTVKNFVKKISPIRVAEIKDRIKYASIGPVTSKTLKESGLNVDLEAEKSCLDGLVSAIVKFYQKID